MNTKTESLALRQSWLNKLKHSTTGLEQEYTLATGKREKRVYLDSTASTLQLGLVKDIMNRYLPYYSNTHTEVHFGAKVSNAEYEWAHDTVLKFVNADPETYGAFFLGSGVTASINRVAGTLSKLRPEKDVVITSVMEHHSNDLPHRKHFEKVVHIPLEVHETGFGSVIIDAIKRALDKYGDRVNYISMTGVSNVTGVINPIYDIAELAHQSGALMMIDAAQMAAHVPIQMTDEQNPLRNIDIATLSGHKLYAPASPGVVITRKDIFQESEPEELGGGMVDDVFIDRYLVTDNFPDREEAGTPNIAGSIALASVLYALDKVGMDLIADEESTLISNTLLQLNAIEDVVVYGETDFDMCPRAGTLSLNIRGLHHSLTAAILNDYFNIAVRNGCFCAHPYVRELISYDLAERMDDLTNAELEALADLHRGMVRVSFGLYNDEQDTQKLIEALSDICHRKDYYLDQYHQNEAGNYVHNTFHFDSASVYQTENEVDAWFNED